MYHHPGAGTGAWLTPRLLACPTSCWSCWLLSCSVILIAVSFGPMPELSFFLLTLPQRPCLLATELPPCYLAFRPTKPSQVPRHWVDGAGEFPQPQILHMIGTYRGVTRDATKAPGPEVDRGSTLPSDLNLKNRAITEKQSDGVFGSPACTSCARSDVSKNEMRYVGSGIMVPGLA